MSLQLAAKHLASKGRGPDTQLVHMSPREVAGLQALAMAHGGSLTTNPDTGLPEAGFLDNLLPTIIGAGLMYATGGAAAGFTPGMIGLGLGAFETARTGNLEKGLMAGLGAYGGAGMFGALAGAGGAAGAAGTAGTAGTAGPGMVVTNPAAAQEAFRLSEIAAQNAAQTAVPSTLSLGAELPAQFAMPSAPAIQTAALPPFGEAPITAASTVTPPPVATPSSAFDMGSHVERVGTPPRGFLDGMSEVAAVEGPGVAKAGLPTGAGAASNTVAERFAAMPTKDKFKYGLAALSPALLAQPKYKAPELDREQYRYAYTPGPAMPPTRSGDVGEYTYFRPQYARLAAGGPIEAMSAANVYDMQSARGGVSDMGIDNSTGMQKMARGGISHLGDYSDGGRLLRGPGDGVSDSIPAMIGRKQPARLADGEFVIPARIVSELGNGSTNAGARKLYAMMDRIQKARGKTVGKGKVAKNSKAEKYLPA